MTGDGVTPEHGPTLAPLPCYSDADFIRLQVAIRQSESMLHDSLHRIDRAMLHLERALRAAPTKQSSDDIEEAANSVSIVGRDLRFLYREITFGELGQAPIDVAAAWDSATTLVRSRHLRFQSTLKGLDRPSLVPPSATAILVQLVLNSVEAAIRSRLKATVNLTAVQIGDGRIGLCVSDTSGGLQSGQMPVNNDNFDEQVLRPGFTTSKQSGAGWGLTLVHALVKQYGGTVELESNPGGCRVSFDLPELTKRSGVVASQ